MATKPKCEYMVTPKKKCGRVAKWRVVVGRGQNLCAKHVNAAIKFNLPYRPIR